MINIQVMSMDLAQDIGTFEDDTLVISIGSPGFELPELKGKNIFQFRFHDIVEDLFIEHENRIIRPVSREIIESIVDIAFEHRDLPVWVIHCEAGVSRSPGVALGLASVISTAPGVQQLEFLYPCYNKYVRALTEEVAKEKVSKMLEQLKAIDIGG